MGIPGIPSMAMGPMSVPGTGTTLTITRRIKQAKIIKNCNRADFSTPIAPPAFDTVTRLRSADQFVCNSKYDSLDVCLLHDHDVIAEPIYEIDYFKQDLISLDRTLTISY